MGVFERELEGDEQRDLIKKFTNNSDFKEAVRKLKNFKSITEDEYDEVRGFELINETEIDNKDVTIHELTLYLKYYSGVLIELSEIKIKVKDDRNKRTLFTVDVSILNSEGKLKKFSMENGEFIFETTIDNPKNECIDIPEFLEVSTDSENVEVNAIDGVALCMDWTTGSGTCCEFRYNANQSNPLVKYNWCGANCGGGCGDSPSIENPLDSCCKTHDCCYVTYGSYPDRCSCDRVMINCAGSTDEAGSSRVKTAIQIKKTLHPSCLFN